MGKYWTGMVIGGALGMTAAAAAVSLIEPRIGRVLKRRGRQAAKITKRKLNQMM